MARIRTNEEIYDQVERDSRRSMLTTRQIALTAMFELRRELKKNKGKEEPVAIPAENEHA